MLLGVILISILDLVLGQTCVCVIPVSLGLVPRFFKNFGNATASSFIPDPVSFGDFHRLKGYEIPTTSLSQEILVSFRLLSLQATGQFRPLGICSHANPPSLSKRCMTVGAFHAAAFGLSCKSKILDEIQNLQIPS